MSNFNHLGVQIELTNVGTFAAFVGGKRIVKTSLAAIKKAIDVAGKTAFKPFTLLTAIGRAKGIQIKKTGYYRIKAIGIEANGRRNYRMKKVFLLESDTGRVTTEYADAYKDCPEAVKAIEALAAHKEKARRINDELEKTGDHLEDAIAKFKISAEDFAPGKK